jgi:hypothetical protein
MVMSRSFKLFLEQKAAVFAAVALAVIGAAVLPPEPEAAGEDISGVVMGDKAPEAGVWVIAETSELPTSFRKIVVTDDRGRFLVPDLPAATYRVWVRGYGLVDSSKTQATPGDNLSLKVKSAATPQEAAQVYPANYWYSLMKIPGANEFDPKQVNKGTGSMPTQLHFVDILKDRCELCHQLGTKLTREVNLNGLTSTGAWAERLKPSGMTNELNLLGGDRALKMFADWSDRIAAGAVPPQPPRPQGQERNVVISMWGWAGTPHDSVSTDKRRPTLNANGPVFGIGLLVADPVANTTKRVTQGGRGGHNPMMDEKGRVWITTRFRDADNPAWCKEGSTHPSAKYFPIERNINDTRQLSFHDPRTGDNVLVDTCFPTHHLQFAHDADSTVFTSGSGEVVGWFNTRVFDKTSDAQLAQGWCPTVVDTNGDGKIDRPWNEPTATRANITNFTGKPLDPKLDTQVTGFAYGIIPSPVDGSVWIARRQPTPGSIVRLELGANPPATCKSEIYEPPFQNANLDASKWGYGPRGIDVDRNGVIWTALGGSGHLASFDRRKCKVLNGPTATGQHCPEGWTLHSAPGPKLAGVIGSPSADFHYYNWVDQFNTLGLGENVPIANGTGSDSLLVLNPKTGDWLILRVPYPLGFYTRGLDGRIDDPKAGWKGRGLWASNNTGALHHTEGATKNSGGEIVRFQIRPNPLAD